MKQAMVSGMIRLWSRACASCESFGYPWFVYYSLFLENILVSNIVDVLGMLVDESAIL